MDRDRIRTPEGVRRIAMRIKFFKSYGFKKADFGLEGIETDGGNIFYTGEGLEHFTMKNHKIKYIYFIPPLWL